MKRAIYGLWLFALLMIVSTIAGRLYGKLGGGLTGALVALLTLGGGVLFYLVGVTILSHLWAGFDRLRGRS